MKISIVNGIKRRPVGRFKDSQNQRCTVEIDTDSPDPRLIIGVSSNRNGIGVKDGRMYLTQDDVDTLMTVLQEFRTSGNLPDFDATGGDL